ncbi:MAG: aminopeptidase P family N-terminal domain-containing protein [Bacteroidaceae bacterium]|nr:aminopeptidase P family N-terminal domain-containing protein [Bacteroidaceae bacterium]
MTDKLTLLRRLMAHGNIQAIVVPSTDPHSGEYVPDHWECRAWISEFHGSAGTAVVTTDKAALWTDSRYFLAAEQVFRDSEFVLMKEKIEGTPTISQWLGSVLPKGATVAVDGWTNTVTAVEQLTQELKAVGINIVTAIPSLDDIWTDRPPLPLTPVVIHGLEYSGERASSKIARIRRQMLDEGNADDCSLLISMLDEVAWTLNLRGSDIEYNPVFVSYLLVRPDTACLYIDRRKLTPEVTEYLKGEGVEVRDYDTIGSDLRQMDSPVQIQPDKTNYACYSYISKPVRRDCPVSVMKIMKNPTEIAGFRSAMLRDGIAMVKWLKWLLPAVEAGGQTEMSLSRKLHEMRCEQPLFMGESFATIMGYGWHGADIHYEPTDESDIPVLPEGLLLCDSGGQYLDGTTDVTRTIPLGPLTDTMRQDYTLVLKGWINIARVHFPHGTYGSQLDVLARAPMWERGTNFLHGTGHGVGSYLCVHEGPHQFRMNYMPQPLLPGMPTTGVPVVYIEASHRVRHAVAGHGQGLAEAIEDDGALPHSR